MEYISDAPHFSNLSEEQRRLLRYLEKTLITLREEAVKVAHPKNEEDRQTKISLNVCQEDIIKRYW